MKSYNIYCDESCHILNDKSPTFVIGGIWVEEENVKQILEDLRNLKVKHKLAKTFEAKWTKISKSKENYYLDVVKYFFENDKLHFRAVVVPDKSVLNHLAFNQDHDTWYYKMFYILLNILLKAESKYSLYLDMKDTRSNLKVLELKRILNIANNDDFPVNKAQQIRSHEVELMQVTDILLGSLSYSHRGLQENQGKKNVVELIELTIGKNILSSSSVDEEKFNVLVWKPRTII
ncbi:MAG: DUF3800 domain-containing protein [bacterium]